MVTTGISLTTIGRLAMLIGASAILAVIFLALMYTVKPSLGFVNDILNSLIGILSAILAIILYAKFYDKFPTFSQINLGLVVVGAIATIVGTILVVARVTNFTMAGWYTGIGYALIGLWLISFCLTILGSDMIPHNLAVFGVVVGVIMALGLIGILGIIAKIDTMESMPKYLYIAFLCYLGTYILYPIWAIMLGRYFLSK